MKVWGCLAKVGLPDFKRKNIGPKTVDVVFVGYSENNVDYKFAEYRFMLLSNRSMCESRDAEFFENAFPFKKNIISDVIQPVVHASNSDYVPSSSASKDIDMDMPRRSKRRRIKTDFGPDFLTSFLVELKDVDELDESFVCLQMLEEDPKTYEEAMSSIDANFWKDAINSELESIRSNLTWELVDLPKGSKIIGCRWIFKRKFKTDGTIERFKARLVVKGFKQKFGEDFFYTYSPVTKITTIRTLFALASMYNLIIHQMDVKTAFLNGELEEEIYMMQPPGFVVPGQEHKVCRLKKSLYGLR